MEAFWMGFHRTFPAQMAQWFFSQADNVSGGPQSSRAPESKSDSTLIQLLISLESQFVGLELTSALALSGMPERGESVWCIHWMCVTVRGHCLLEYAHDSLVTRSLPTNCSKIHYRSLMYFVFCFTCEIPRKKTKHLFEIFFFFFFLSLLQVLADSQRTFRSE